MYQYFILQKVVYIQYLDDVGDNLCLALCLSFVFSRIKKGESQGKKTMMCRRACDAQKCRFGTALRDKYEGRGEKR